VIPRYELPEVAAVWSDHTRMANWLEIELLAVEADPAAGTVAGELDLGQRTAGERHVLPGRDQGEDVRH